MSSSASATLAVADTLITRFDITSTTRNPASSSLDGIFILPSARQPSLIEVNRGQGHRHDAIASITGWWKAIDQAQGGRRESMGRFVTRETRMLKKIRLALARGPGHPEGDQSDGYEFVAPLGPDFRIDSEAWKAVRLLCSVHRIENGQIAQRGHLAHHPGGSGGATWRFEYTDEAGRASGYDYGFHLADRAFVVGEYVSLKEADEETTKTYRVASVTPAKMTAP